jgi:hypothetical protein
MVIAAAQTPSFVICVYNRLKLKAPSIRCMQEPSSSQVIHDSDVSFDFVQ